MLNNLVVLYLFLGGMGAGACGVLCVLSFGRLGTAARVRGSRSLGSIFSQRFFGFGFLIASALCVVGAFCLLADMKRPDEVLTLIVSPTLSVVSIGAYTLAATIFCGVFSGLAWLGVFGVAPLVMRIVAIVYAVLSIVVMTYTALLLMAFSGVPLFRSPLIIPLFLASSLSCGMALVVVYAFISRTWEDFSVPLRRLALVDMVVLVVELLVLAVFLWAVWDASPESVMRLVSGELAVPFWFGFVFCGLAAPLAFYVVQRKVPTLSVNPAFPAALVIIGGFMLRWCILTAA